MKPFRISDNYLDFAHGPGAEDGQPLASRIMAWPRRTCHQGRYVLIDDPELVYEIADVAELYIDEPDYRMQSRRVFNRATAWLRENGVNFRLHGY